MKRILVSWIGHTDLKAMVAKVPESQSKAVRKIVGDVADSKAGDGPVKTLLDNEPFDHVHLLSDYGLAASKEFAAWLSCSPKLHEETIGGHCTLTGGSIQDFVKYFPPTRCYGPVVPARRSALSPIGTKLYGRIGAEVLARHPPNLVEYLPPNKVLWPRNCSVRLGLLRPIQI